MTPPLYRRRTARAVWLGLIKEIVYSLAETREFLLPTELGAYCQEPVIISVI